MKPIYDRTEKLIGSDGMEKLRSASVFIAGLGGVGGYVCEALARAGVGHLGLCDFDTVDPTNLNRQILALENTVGRQKTEVALERVRSINPDCRVEVFPFRLNEETLRQVHLPDWSFAADAIDDVPAKLLLIESCCNNGVPVISSMGTGNKLDPSCYRIVPIEKTEYDPLARVMRRELKARGIKGVPVLYSPEAPAGAVPRGEAMPTVSYMPAVAGLMIAGYVIREIAGKHRMQDSANI